MARSTLRLLFLSDSHLGFDLPRRPRVARCRRGDEFFASFERALAPALQGEVDLVVHGGDLLFRSKVPAWLVERALAPLWRVADAGVPVCLVPGNHERSQLPFRLLAQRAGLHVFDRPQTHAVDVGPHRVALVGFPYQRQDVRVRFPELLARCGWRRVDADVRLLCLHHCVEGATVGPSGFTFRYAPDVVRARDLPAGFAAVLAGHVHRHQVLWRDLDGRRLSAPVVYAGSTERTSFAERDEVKGFVRLDLAADATSGGRLLGWRFCPLPTRPMVVRELDGAGLDPAALEAAVCRAIAAAPADALLRVRLRGLHPAQLHAQLPSARLRALAPPTMNITLAAELRRSPEAV